MQPQTNTEGTAAETVPPVEATATAPPAPPEVDTKAAQAEAARAKAAEFMTERRYAEARQALEEADKIETESEKPSDTTWKTHSRRVLTALRSKLPTQSKPAQSSEEAATPAPSAEPAATEGVGAVDEALKVVSLYSKIAVVVGLLPGGLLNFAAVLAVQVTMVWRIANVFGHKEGKDRIRGSILSLLGAAVPTSVGHGTAFLVASIPAVVAGTILYFVVTPVLAFAMTQAVGKAFIMHFESGGTLLTFDPRAFGEYFIKEFQKAGGTLKTETAS